MMERSRKALLLSLERRSKKGVAAGGDGFIATGTLCLDVGLNTRTIRRVLDHEVATGTIERRSNGPGRAYSYKFCECKRETRCS